jgi:hypothetical protein
MNVNDVMATRPRLAVRVARIGQAAVWVAVAGLLAVLVVGATVNTADAKGASHSSQNGFVRSCKNLGGTPKRIESRVVECSFPKNEDGSGGGSVTCDFNQQYYTCKYKLGPRAGGTDVPFGPIEDMISAGEAASNPREPAVSPVDDIATAQESR